MVYKLFDEHGDYVDIVTGKEVNLLEANIAHTPEGVNVGWKEFGCLDDALTAFSIRRKHSLERIPQENIEENLVGDMVNNIIDTPYEEVK